MHKLFSFKSQRYTISYKNNLQLYIYFEHSHLTKKDMNIVLAAVITILKTLYASGENDNNYYVA